MSKREEQQAILRYQQKQQYKDSLPQEQPLTSARLKAIDPSTGLDIVSLDDGGTLTAARIFEAGHAQDTFVRATEAPGGTTVIDWLNAPDLPENIEEEQRSRTRQPVKELDPGSMAILYINEETLEEPVDCRCTTYKKIKGRKGYQIVCDGSGEKEPGDELLESVEPRWTPLYDILEGLIDISDVIVCIVLITRDGDPFVPSSQTGTKVPPVSLINSTLIELLRQGSSVVFRMAVTPYPIWGDPSVQSFFDAQYNAEVALSSATVAQFGGDVIKHPVFGINLSLGFSFWYGDMFGSPIKTLTVPGSASSILPNLSGDFIAPFHNTQKAIVDRVCQDIILPVTGVSLQTEWVSLMYGSATNRTFTVSKLNAPNPVNPSFPVFIHGEIRMPLPSLQPATGTWTVVDQIPRFSHDPGFNASGSGYSYQGTGDRRMDLGFIAPADAVGVRDGTHSYLLHWEGSKLNPEYKGNVVIDMLPGLSFRDGNFTHSTLNARLATVVDFLGDTDDVVDKVKFKTSLATFQSGMMGRHAADDQGREAYATLGQNLPFWLSPRNKTQSKPGKRVVVFWLGGITETPIRITELNKDDPYEAYLSSTPEKIFVTVKASKEYGYKALPLKRRPWCTITTWELDRGTMTLSAPQKFHNPDEVTTNQDDWQKIWAHDYNPIDPVQVKPAKFNIPTTRFGVSTANHTFNLTPFIQGSDPALVPKLTNITFVSVTAGGSGSVLSWNADALTFVYKGNVTSLYTIVFNYTVDDGASTESSTITLNGSMIVPNLLYSFSSAEPNSINLTPQTYNIGAGDARGNVPQVIAGRTRTLVSVEFESVGVEAGSTQQSNGSFFTTSARFGGANNFNPLGSFTSFNAGALTMIWADNYVRNGRAFGGYTAKLRYTISDGFEERTGIIYVYISIEAGSFG